MPKEGLVHSIPHTADEVQAVMNASSGNEYHFQHTVGAVDSCHIETDQCTAGNKEDKTILTGNSNTASTCKG